MNDDFLDAILANPIAAIATFYATCFNASERAVDYAKETLGLNDEEATKQQLGFADRTLGKQIPQRRIKRGRQVRDALVKAGLYKANGRETMRGRVTVPIINDDGNIIGLRGYKIDAHATGEDVITTNCTVDDNTDNVAPTIRRAALAPVPLTDEPTTKQTNDTKATDAISTETQATDTHATETPKLLASPTTKDNNELTIEASQINFMRQFKGVKSLW